MTQLLSCGCHHCSQHLSSRCPGESGTHQPRLGESPLEAHGIEHVVEVVIGGVAEQETQLEWHYFVPCGLRRLGHEYKMDYVRPHTKVYCAAQLVLEPLQELRQCGAVSVAQCGLLCRMCTHDRPPGHSLNNRRHSTSPRLEISRAPPFSFHTISTR